VLNFSSAAHICPSNLPQLLGIDVTAKLKGAQPDPEIIIKALTVFLARVIADPIQAIALVKANLCYADQLKMATQPMALLQWLKKNGVDTKFAPPERLDCSEFIKMLQAATGEGIEQGLDAGPEAEPMVEIEMSEVTTETLELKSDPAEKPNAKNLEGESKPTEVKSEKLGSVVGEQIFANEISLLALSGTYLKCKHDNCKSGIGCSTTLDVGRRTNRRGSRHKRKDPTRGEQGSHYPRALYPSWRKNSNGEQKHREQLQPTGRRNWECYPRTLLCSG
jgi:hypothetical protein